MAECWLHRAGAEAVVSVTPFPLPAQPKAADNLAGAVTKSYFWLLDEQQTPSLFPACRGSQLSGARPATPCLQSGWKSASSLNTPQLGIFNSWDKTIDLPMCWASGWIFSIKATLLSPYSWSPSVKVYLRVLKVSVCYCILCHKSANLQGMNSRGESRSRGGM